MEVNRSLEDKLKGMPLEMFIDMFCTVFNQEISEYVPFDLWPKQAELCRFMEYWRVRGNNEFIFPKARQNGVSEIASSLACKDLIAYKNNLILCISSTQPKAKEFMNTRFLTKYKNLPKGLPWPKIVKETQEEVVLSNGSRFLSLPASDTSAQSFTGGGLILDECGAIDRQNNASFDQIYINGAPAIEKSGSRGWLLQIGTSEPGTAYNAKVKRVVDKEDTFTKMFFLGWKADPNRGEAWLARTKEKYPDDASFKTQYPATIDDFFVVKEGLVIPQFDHTENGRHVKEFTVPQYYCELIFGYDDGYRHPSALLTTFFETTTGKLYVWDEWYQREMSVYDKSRAIKKIIAITERTHNLVSKKKIADSAIFNKVTGARSVADEFATNGVIFTKARKHGGLKGANSSLEKLRKMFHEDKVVIHPRCRNLINDLNTWKYKKGLREEIEDVNDEGPDILRYIVEDINYVAESIDEEFEGRTGYKMGYDRKKVLGLVEKERTAESCWNY